MYPVLPNIIANNRSLASIHEIMFQKDKTDKQSFMYSRERNNRTNFLQTFTPGSRN